MHERSRTLRLLAGLIALIAGYVDAIGFVGFGGLFVSFMSGNSTRLGATLAPGASAAWLALAVIGCFVAGAAVGQAVGGREDRARRVRVLSLVAGALALAAVLPLLALPAFALLLAAFAMGATNTVFSATPLPVGLTYMTGTLVKLGESLGQRLRGLPAAPMAPYLLHWLALVLGATLGAWVFTEWRFVALWPAAIGMAMLALAVRRSVL